MEINIILVSIYHSSGCKVIARLISSQRKVFGRSSLLRSDIWSRSFNIVSIYSSGINTCSHGPCIA